MSKRPKISSLVVEYVEPKPGFIPGMIEVVSVNEHGFRISTSHVYERGAKWEREQRKQQGHQVSA